MAEKGVKELTYHRDYAGRWFLTLAQGKDVFVSDSVARRLDRLAEAMGVTAEIVTRTATAARGSPGRRHC